MEKTVENLDKYIERIRKIKAMAEDLFNELESLDEDFMDPYGINQDMVEAANEEGDDWEDLYEPLQEMELYRIPDALDEWLETFNTDKEELYCKTKNDKVYQALFNDIYNKKATEGVEPILIGMKEFEDLYDTLYIIVNTGTKEDFVKHMFKMGFRRNN